MMTVDSGTRVLLADGRVAVVRRLSPADVPDVLALHERLDDHDSYLRFLGPRPKQLARLVERFVAGDEAGDVAVGAFREDRLVGVAHYATLAGTSDAEVALTVDSSAQAHGVGTLLLESLATIARPRGIRSFVAEVSGENTRMLRVFRDLGLRHRISPAGPERAVVVSLDRDERYLDAVIERERGAVVASLRPLLIPSSVAVIGAGRSAGSVGRAVLANLVDSGYRGRLFAVNPHADEVLGVPAFPSVSALPDAVDLAVVGVPAAAVPGVVEECGRRGVPAVVVVPAGISGTDLAAGVRASVRKHGLRLVGPNCLGVANTVDGASLNATFMRGAPPAGRVGVVTQSGGVGIAIADVLRALGLGVSTMVSTGDKYDVSGNDLLLWWMCDPGTAIAVLYLESFGNPRKFGRIARAVARRKPVVAVRSGSSPAGRRAAASHTAASVTPVVSRDALFDQAGVIAVNSLSEAAGVVAALTWQPLPRGQRVAVVGNAGGLCVLAADACARHGLALAELTPSTLDTLRGLLPATASPRNPVDTTAAADAETFGACLDAVLADDCVDIVLAEPLATAVGDPGLGVARRALASDKPLFIVRAGQLPVVEPVLGEQGTPVTACFGDPETAVAIVAHLARYAAWLDQPAGRTVEVAGLSLDPAVSLVRSWLAEHTEGGWLDPGLVTKLLRCFGIDMAETRFAASETRAAAIAHQIAGPVAVKAVAEGILHKSAGGGVLLGVSGEHRVREAFRSLHQRFADRFRGVVVQPMAAPGRELLMGLVNDGVFGPLVVFGLGGTDTDVIDDRTAHLAPLTDLDAARLVHGLRSSAKVFREETTAPVEDLLIRVSRTAEALPEMAELDLNPVVFAGGRCQVLDARIRLTPRPGAEDFPRALRG